MFSKKLFLTLTLTSTLFLQHATAFSFLDSSQPASQSEKSVKPLSEEQIARLNKTIQIIQHDYISTVSEKTLMNNAITGMVTKLDPHSAFLDKQELTNLQTTVSGEFVGIGVELTTEHGVLRVISPITGSPAAKAGLKPGDLIVKVNNSLIQDMSINDAINAIKGKPGTTVTLTVMRKSSDKPIIMNIVREMVKVDAVKSKLLAPGYAYIQLSFFQGPVAEEMKKAIEKLKAESGGHLDGLILDLRNNPGGLLDVSADVVDMFADKSESAKFQNKIVYTKGRIPNSDVTFYAHDSDIIPHTPMVVLINGGSASASEITAGALQDYKRAIIMGTRSFGKGSVQTVIPIDNTSALKLTTALYYTPAGREIQARGIEPDVIVPELSVNDKQLANSVNITESNYDHHIVNNSENKMNLAKAGQDKDTVELAKTDYQLYEALMMLQGMHAMH